MEFIHTADWHLFNKFKNFDKNIADFLNNARLNAMEKIFDYARKNSIKLILSSGDQLDDGIYENIENLNKIYNIFSKYPEVKIIMITGNHDPLSNYSVYNKIDNTPNNLIFIRKQIH